MFALCMVWTQSKHGVYSSFRPGSEVQCEHGISVRQLENFSIIFKMGTRFVQFLQEVALSICVVTDLLSSLLARQPASQSLSPVLFLCALHVLCYLYWASWQHKFASLLVYGCVVCVYHCWAAYDNTILLCVCVCHCWVSIMTTHVCFVYAVFGPVLRCSVNTV